MNNAPRSVTRSFFRWVMETIKPTMITRTNTNDVVSLQIRGMVCARCIDVVRNIIQAKNLAIPDIRRGQVHIQGPVTSESLDRVRSALARQGFSVLTDTKAAIVQQTKTVVEQILNRYPVPERSRTNRRLERGYQQPGQNPDRSNNRHTCGRRGKKSHRVGRVQSRADCPALIDSLYK